MLRELYEYNQTLTLKRDMYQKNYEAFDNELERIMSSFQFDIVVYDENELFRQHDDPLFSYPYEPRKTIAGRQELSLNQVGHSATTIGFGLSDVCLEGNYYDQFYDVIFDVIDEIKELIFGEDE